MHNYISNLLSNFINQNIYNNSKELLNKSIFKLEYLIYFRFYLIYLFLILFKKNQFIDYSLLLHIQYISSLTFKNLYNNYNISSKYNLPFLDNLGDYLFLYLYSIKIYFKNDINYINKFFINSLSLIYFFLYQINDLYKTRLKSIEQNSEFKHYLKILFSNPNIKDIKNIIESTNIFNLSNYYIFINIISFFLFI